jgi:hypothetical protein
MGEIRQVVGTTEEAAVDVANFIDIVRQLLITIPVDVMCSVVVDAD